MKDLKVRRELFWDMDFDAMDEHIHRVHIVQQVLNLGTLEEYREILRYYGREGVIDAAKQAGWFDPKTFSFVTKVLGIKKSDVQCYIKKRLNQPHWN